MDLIDFSRVCEFYWVQDADFAKLTEATIRGIERFTKFCYAGTQYHRVYVVGDKDGIRFMPYECKDGQWGQTFPHLYKVTEFDILKIQTEEQLKESLAWQMCLQWPMAISGYYEIPPDKDAILSQLEYNSTVDDLKTLRYQVYETSIQSDLEWDGGISVVCDGGELVIPYVGPTQRLLLEYATFKPDIVGYTFIRTFSLICDKVFSLVSNIHWSDIRELIQNWR